MQSHPLSALRLSGQSAEALTEAIERALFTSTGKSVKLSLTPKDVHDPTELPTYLAGYRPPMYRADELSPVVLVDKDQDKFRSWSSDDAFRRVDVKGAQDVTPLPEISPTSSLSQYKVVDRFIATFIPDEVELNAGPNYKPRMAGTRRCSRAILLDREVDILGTGGLLSTATNFAAGNRIALTNAQRWNGGVDSNPIADLQNILEVSAQEINGFWMNQKVANAFVRHPLVKDHFRFYNGDASLQGAITNLNMPLNRAIDFVIPGVGLIHVVASKVKNETTSAIEYVMPNIVVATTVPPGVPTDGEDIATTYTFRRRGPSGTGFETREFRIENRGPLGGTMIVCSMADIGIVTANNAGGIITNVVG
jgi:hypothetical protein